MGVLGALGGSCASSAVTPTSTPTATASPIGGPAEGDGVLGQWVGSGGLQRTYGLHVAPGCGASVPCPLIVAFHGAGGSHEFAERVGLHEAADRAGFVVAAPDGIAGSWALGCGGCTVADRNGVDDVKMTATLVSHLAKNMAIDVSRVYATGHSDGGSFTHRLACSYPLAGAAPVAGTLFNPAGCRPSRPVPLVAFHGQADTVIPFALGAGAVQTWGSLNGCSSDSVLGVALPDLEDDGTTVVRYDFAGCRQGSEVTLFAIDGGGHNWPGAPAAAGGGPQTRDIQASEEMVDFFARHPGPAGSAAAGEVGAD
jgi:polyhydroxybutyrate depolymerase